MGHEDASAPPPPIGGNVYPPPPPPQHYEQRGEHHHHHHTHVQQTTYEHHQHTHNGGLGAPLVVRPHNPQWTTGLCSCDRPLGTCLYGLFCSPCVYGTIRSEYDEGNCLFNALCLGPVIARSLIRSGYGIDGDACCDDLIIGGFLCQPCAAAQMLHEVRTRGPIKKPNGTGGEEWRKSIISFDCGACFLGWCFPCCGIASAREKFDGSSYCLNCTMSLFGCLTLPMARNILREGYGIEGNCCFDILLSTFLSPCVISQMIQEAECRGKVSGPTLNIMQ